MRVFLDSSMICQCKFCGSLLEYDNDDIRLGGDFLRGEKEYYIICPVCNHSITIGYAKGGE